MASVDISEIHNVERAKGQANVLAIGTANPPNVMYQADYPDFYFRLTNSEHMTDLKAKFKRICTFFPLLHTIPYTLYVVAYTYI